MTVIPKLLSHYTVFDGKVWKLNLFEYSNGTISHTEYTEETADTIFISGILIISEKLRQQQIEELNGLIKSSIQVSLEEAAIEICDYITRNDIKSHANFIPHLYKATLPFISIAPITADYRSI